MLRQMMREEEEGRAKEQRIKVGDDGGYDINADSDDAFPGVMMDNGNVILMMILMMLVMMILLVVVMGLYVLISYHTLPATRRGRSKRSSCYAPWRPPTTPT